jgi:hypothetical protein
VIFAPFRGYRGPNAFHPGEEVQGLDHEMHERGERRERGFAFFTIQAACGKQGCVECLSGVRVQAAEFERLGGGVLS